MRTRSTRQQHGSLPRAAARLGQVLVVVLVVAIAWAIGPGGARVALLSGHSMEPTLHDGDLIIVRDDPSPAIGDLVLFDLGGGSVLHRLVDGDAAAGWSTRGDHNDHLDHWVVHGDDVRGRFWFRVPGGGHAIEWLLAHPVAAGAVIASPFLLGLVVRRRRWVRDTERSVQHPVFADWMMPAALLSATTLLLFVVVRRMLGAAPDVEVTAALAAGLLVAGATTWSVGWAALSGGRRPEPQRSLWALDGLLVAVDQLPEGADAATAVPSASALRDLAEGLGVPVLHHVSTDGAWHLFAVRSSGRTWVWSPLPAAEVAQRADAIEAARVPVAAHLSDSLRAAPHRLPDRTPADRGRRHGRHRCAVADRSDDERCVGAA